MGSHSASRNISEGSFSDAFSTLQLFRSFNNLVTPIPDVCRYDSYPKLDYPLQPEQPEVTRTGNIMLTGPPNLAPSGFSLGELLQPPLLPPLLPPVSMSHSFSNASAAAVMNRNIIENAVITSMQQSRRPRSEKKPIPDDQKDAKYYERRKRNNQAAKKSRDARKMKENQIALRATVLERDNAILLAEVVRLRNECQSLSQLLQVKHRGSPPGDAKPAVALTPVVSLPCQ